MATNDIIFNRGRGGLGRALDGEDHISGIVIPMAQTSMPAALLAVEGYAVLFSVQDAEDLGIEYTEDASNIGLDQLKYAIDTLFDENDKAVVYLGVVNTTLTGDDEQTINSRVRYIQNESDGKIRQALVLDPENDFAVGSIAPLQAICDDLESEHKPISLFYAPNFVGVAAWTTADVRALNSKNLTTIAGMDGNGTGFGLYESYNKTFSAGGAFLGAVSRASVHENVAWVGQFNLNGSSSTNEFDVVALADGRAVKQVSQSELDTINTSGFVFCKKHIGRAGSYFNDTHTCISESSDYAYLENTRTIDKGVRGTREFLLPLLNSPLYVNEDGTLAEDTIATFRNEAERALEEMQRLGEISQFEVTIDPNQNVLSTSQLSITIKIVPVGVARNIVVNIGFALKIG